MEFGRGPGPGVSSAGPRTPQSRHRNRSGTAGAMSPSGMSRVNQSPSQPMSRLNQSPCMTPRRDMASGIGGEHANNSLDTSS